MNSSALTFSFPTSYSCPKVIIHSYCVMYTEINTTVYVPRPALLLINYTHYLIFKIHAGNIHNYCAYPPPPPFRGPRYPGRSRIRYFCTLTTYKVHTVPYTHTHTHIIKLQQLIVSVSWQFGYLMVLTSTGIRTRINPSNGECLTTHLYTKSLLVSYRKTQNTHNGSLIKIIDFK